MHIKYTGSLIQTSMQFKLLKEVSIRIFLFYVVNTCGNVLDAKMKSLLFKCYFMSPNANV